MNNDPDNFQFAIVADRTGSHRPGAFADAVPKINHLQPDFVMCVGDLVEGDDENVDVLVAQWDEFDAMVEKLEMPFFYLTGNHDLTSEKAIQIYKQRRGRAYYHFLYKDVLFLCMNSEDILAKSDGIGDEQIEYFADVLKKHQNATWVCVFVHKPIWQKKDANGWQKFAPLLSGRKHTVFSGHDHKYSKAIRNGVNYYKLATTGAGSASKLKGPQQGKFDHVMWVTMTDQGPRIANLLLDGIFGDDPPTEAKLKNLNDQKTTASSPK
ncbi:MAG: hypothetical protein FVQ79_11425 [Planctomycetes bacterium]|nr:hypothetical protein [Planctomycetota bacterium]